jgi:hypothetical protein
MSISGLTESLQRSAFLLLWFPLLLMDYLYNKSADVLAVPSLGALSFRGSLWGVEVWPAIGYCGQGFGNSGERCARKLAANLRP